MSKQPSRFAKSDTNTRMHANDANKFEWAHSCTPSQKRGLRYSSAGVAALPITLSVMGVVVLVAVTLTLVGFSELFTSKSVREADEAFYIAEFGVQDALIRLARGATSTDIMFYQPEATTYPDLWVGVNDVGSANPSTPCKEEDFSMASDSCSTCKTYDGNEAGCNNEIGCVWNPGPATCKVSATKLVCSEAKVQTGTKSEKKALIQVVADVDSMGIVKQCSWEQL